MTSHSGAQGSVSQADPSSICIVHLDPKADASLHSNLDALSGDLEQAGLAVTWAADTSLGTALEADHSAILAFLPPLEQAVAALISNGVSPSTALNDTLRGLGETLKVYRRNRRTICLIQTSGFAHADHLLQAIADRLDVTGLSAQTSYSALPRPAPLPLTIAAQTVAASPDATSLKGELEASSLAVAPAGDGVDVDAAFVALQDLLTQAETAQTLQETDVQGEIDELKAEQSTKIANLVADYEQKIDGLGKELSQAHAFAASKEAALTDAALHSQKQADQLQEAAHIKDLLLAQLKAVQVELETHFTAATHHSAQRQGLETELSLLSRKLQRAKTETQELRKRDTASVKRLTTTKAELESATQNLTDVQAKLDARTRELTRFKGSTSWKLTKPLRVVKDSIKPGKS